MQERVRWWSVVAGVALTGAMAVAVSVATEPSRTGHVGKRQAAANELHALYQDWDSHRAARLFPKGVEHLETHLAWYRQRLGHCDAPVPWRVGKHRTRFVMECEGGLWEVAPKVTPAGQIVRLRHGLQEAQPGPGVREMAEAHLSEAPAEWGHCEFRGTDLANARGALFDLECDAGLKMMKVDLRPDGRLGRLRFQERRSRRPGHTR